MRARILVAAAALLLAGCAPAPATPPPAAPASASQDLLARHGLADLDVKQIIERLDTSQEDRTAGPMGSVRAGELVLSDEQSQVTLPIPADSFYLAIAPYVSRTHDCFNHNLATCQGELANESVHVTITDSAGKKLVDETKTTYANGFVGMWLPRDITGTITVTHAGKTVTAPIATGAQDPTCVTTLQLT